MSKSEWVWPNGKRIAVVFNVCLEGWSDGKAPGISPMGNPLPPAPGIVDTMANSWAAYGAKRGIYRLLESFKRFDVKASVMINGVIAERSPEAIKAVADGGHEVLSHSYAMDVIPLLLSEEAERENIARCTRLLKEASGGQDIVGWLSPRGTPSPRSARLLAEAGYTHYGDVFDDDLPYVESFEKKRIVAIPLDTDVNDMPFIKFGSEPAMMLETFKQNLEVARHSGETTVIDVMNHAHIFGRPRGAYYHEKIIELAASSGDVWIATRREIADYVLSRA
ncbi:MAG TPA: polysaccharide deacetylase family protein [Herbaspirillum sp.]|jgi:peptidoglycan/xylan/chitin deacetylase (PgdA/CDA1 family)